MREACEALGLSALARQDRPIPEALAANMGGKERWLEGAGEALGCHVGRGLAPSALGQSTKVGKVGLSPDQPSVKLPAPLKGQHPPLQMVLPLFPLHSWVRVTGAQGQRARLLRISPPPTQVLVGSCN